MFPDLYLRSSSLPKTMHKVPTVHSQRVMLAKCVLIPLAAVCELTAGCGYPRPAHPSIPKDHGATRLPAAEPLSVSGHTSVVNLYAPGRVSYTYQSQSAIYSTQGDTFPQADSINVRAHLILNFSSLNPATTQVVMTAESLSVKRNLTASPSGYNPLVTQVATRQIDLRSGNILQRSGTSDTCAVNTPLPFPSEDLLPAIGTATLPQRAWIDTTIYSMCRAGVRITVTRIAHYDLLDQQPRVNASDTLIRITRSAHLTLHGEGSQWEQPIELTGRGTAQDTITATATRLKSVSSHSTLELSFHSPARNQRFLQLTHSTMVRDQ